MSTHVKLFNIPSNLKKVLRPNFIPVYQIDSHVAPQRVATSSMESRFPTVPAQTVYKQLQIWITVLRASLRIHYLIHHLHQPNRIDCCIGIAIFRTDIDHGLIIIAEQTKRGIKRFKSAIFRRKDISEGHEYTNRRLSQNNQPTPTCRIRIA